VRDELVDEPVEERPPIYNEQIGYIVGFNDGHARFPASLVHFYQVPRDELLDVIREGPSRDGETLQDFAVGRTRVHEKEKDDAPRDLLPKCRKHLLLVPFKLTSWEVPRKALLLVNRQEASVGKVV
jgi:hypothetical protein